MLFVGVGKVLLWPLLVPSCSLPVYSLKPLGSFFLYIVFYRSKKIYTSCFMFLKMKYSSTYI